MDSRFFVCLFVCLCIKSVGFYIFSVYLFFFLLSCTACALFQSFLLTLNFLNWGKKVTNIERVNAKQFNTSVCSTPDSKFCFQIQDTSWSFVEEKSWMQRTSEIQWIETSKSISIQTGRVKDNSQPRMVCVCVSVFQ